MSIEAISVMWLSHILIYFHIILKVVNSLSTLLFLKIIIRYFLQFRMINIRRCDTLLNVSCQAYSKWKVHPNYHIFYRKSNILLLLVNTLLKFKRRILKAVPSTSIGQSTHLLKYWENNATMASLSFLT